MSSTKLYEDSAVTSSDGDDDTPFSAGDEQRRRYLMRYVLAMVGLSTTICVAAGVRMALARSGTAGAGGPPPASILHESPVTSKTPANPASETLSPMASPPEVTSATAARVRPTAPQPIAPQARTGVLENPPSASPQRAAPRAKAHTLAIEHRAPF
jgi:hypothetical protein